MGANIIPKSIEPDIPQSSIEHADEWLEINPVMNTYEGYAMREAIILKLPTVTPLEYIYKISVKILAKTIRINPSDIFVDKTGVNIPMVLPLEIGTHPYTVEISVDKYDRYFYNTYSYEGLDLNII